MATPYHQRMDIIVNTSDIAAARAELARAFGALDTKRPEAWDVYGYPEQVAFAKIKTAYERFGPAHGAVHRLLDTCWEEYPRIKRPDDDEQSPWEKSVSALFKSAKVWPALRDFDRKNLIGRFSALVYRVADGQSLDQPLIRARKLVEVIPLYEDQIKVEAWDTDQTSETYGQPMMFGVRTRSPDAQDTQGAPEAWINVHHSRVQILAEGAIGDMFSGVPMLRAAYNHLVDLEKISGGSAESYLKNSARTVVFQYEPGASVQSIQAADGSTKTVRQIHEEQTQALNRNQDASIVLQGGKAETLQTSISDPTGAYLLAANLFSAAVRIPFTILFGQQTGRLASDQDNADLIARATSRRNIELTPMLEEFITRMQAAGIIEPGEFEVEWPTLGAPTDDEKVTILGKMTDAMVKASSAGIVAPLFDENELRRVVDYEEREELAAMPAPQEEGEKDDREL